MLCELWQEWSSELKLSFIFLFSPQSSFADRCIRASIWEGIIFRGREWAGRADTLKVITEIRMVQGNSRTDPPVRVEHKQFLQGGDRQRLLKIYSKSIFGLWISLKKERAAPRPVGIFWHTIGVSIESLRGKKKKRKRNTSHITESWKFKQVTKHKNKISIFFKQG